MNGIRFDFMPHVFAPWNAFIHVKARKQQKYFASFLPPYFSGKNT